MYLAYFVILAARPITSSTRRAAAVAALTVVRVRIAPRVRAGHALRGADCEPDRCRFGAGGGAARRGREAPLPRRRRAVATYATTWQERLVRSYFHASHERDRLEARLARAQLEGLKHQLQPHFLFNALNAISALIPGDPRAAQRTSMGSASFFDYRSRDRVTTRCVSSGSSSCSATTWRSSVFGSRTGSPSTSRPLRMCASAFVPNLLLQPLVENAIRHGLGPRAAGGTVAVDIARMGPTSGSV